MIGATMDAWIAEVLKVGAGFLSGCGAYWLKTRQMRADYEDLKRRRNLMRAREDDRIERAMKIKDILIDLTNHNVPHERLIEMIPLISGNCAKRMELDDGDDVEVLQLAHSPDEIRDLMANVGRDILYWQLVEEQRRYEAGETKYSDEEYEKIKAVVEAFGEELQESVVRATEDEKNIARGVIAGLLWATGAKLDFFEDGDGITFEDLVSPDEQDDEPTAAESQ